jgi:hypothetical protein
MEAWQAGFATAASPIAKEEADAAPAATEAPPTPAVAKVTEAPYTPAVAKTAAAAISAKATVMAASPQPLRSVFLFAKLWPSLAVCACQPTPAAWNVSQELPSQYC